MLNFVVMVSLSSDFEAIVRNEEEFIILFYIRYIVSYFFIVSIRLVLIQISGSMTLSSHLILRVQVQVERITGIVITFQ